MGYWDKFKDGVDKFSGIASNTSEGTKNFMGGLSDIAAGVNETIGQFEATGEALGLIDAEKADIETVTIIDPASVSNATQSEVSSKINLKIPLMIGAGILLLFGGKKLMG